MSAPQTPSPDLLTAPLGAAERPVAATLDVVLGWLGPVEGREVLDVGCGSGAFAAALGRRGAAVTGIDPLPEAIAEARKRAPDARFEQIGAEAMPFADASFDAVVFLNSLHHVPAEAMRAALCEAVRVSRGPVLVVEPLAEGAFFYSMQPVEDETEIRAAAQAAIRAAEAAGDIQVLTAGEYEDVRSFSGVDGFLAKVVEVDPARADLAARERSRVADLMARHGTPMESGIALPQPHRAHLLSRATV